MSEKMFCNTDHRKLWRSWMRRRRLVHSVAIFSINSRSTRLYLAVSTGRLSKFMIITWWVQWPAPGNTKWGCITVPLTSCLTGLELAVWQLTIFVFICKTDKSKPVKQEVNGTVILPPLSIPWIKYTKRILLFYILSDEETFKKFFLFYFVA